MIKVFLLELGINYFISLLKSSEKPKVKEFLIKQSTYETMLNVSQYYFSLYNKLTDENGDTQPKQGTSTE